MYIFFFYIKKKFSLDSITYIQLLRHYHCWMIFFVLKAVIMMVFPRIICFLYDLKKKLQNIYIFITKFKKCIFFHTPTFFSPDGIFFYTRYTYLYGGTYTYPMLKDNMYFGIHQIFRNACCFVYLATCMYVTIQSMHLTYAPCCLLQIESIEIVRQLGARMENK